MGAPKGNKNAAGPHKGYRRGSKFEHNAAKRRKSATYRKWKKKMGLKAHY